MARTVSSVADLTAELVALRSPSGTEWAVVERCARALREVGLEVSYDRVGNALGVTGDGGPRILFDGHADTVAPNPAWSDDPYRPLVRDGRLIGLGAVDMKGPIAALILGVGDALRRGEIHGTVAVSISTLEEVFEGAALASAIDDFAPDWVVIAEPSGLALMLAQRGRAEIVVTLDGVAAHAAFPERGVSALTGAVAFLSALEEREAPVDEELGAGILVATEARTEPFPGISVVPSRCTIRLDRRTLPGETPERVIAELRNALDRARAGGATASAALTAGPVTTYTGVELDGERFLPAWRTPSTGGLAGRARDALAAALGAVRVSHYAFCTNGSLSAGRLGIPTIGFGPGEPSRAHQADEDIPIADLELARRAYAALAGMAASAW